MFFGAVLGDGSDYYYVVLNFNCSDFKSASNHWLKLLLSKFSRKALTNYDERSLYNNSYF